MSSTGQTAEVDAAYGQMMRRTLTDPSYRARMARDPKTAFAEMNLTVAPDVTLEVVSSTLQHMYLPLPDREGRGPTDFPQSSAEPDSADAISARLADVLRSASADPARRDRLLTQPKAVLADAGIDLPPDLQVTIVRNTPQRHYVIVSPELSGRLVDGELETVVGGAHPAALPFIVAGSLLTATFVGAPIGVVLLGIGIALHAQKPLRP